MSIRSMDEPNNRETEDLSMDSANSSKMIKMVSIITLMIYLNYYSDQI